MVLTNFDPAEHLKSEQAIAAYITEAVLTQDPQYLQHALDVVARVREKGIQNNIGNTPLNKD